MLLRVKLRLRNMTINIISPLTVAFYVHKTPVGEPEPQKINIGGA
jgi:hypothetical protein